MTTVKQHTKCIHGIPLTEYCGTCVHEAGRTDERLLPRMPVKQAIEACHARIVELAKAVVVAEEQLVVALATKWADQQRATAGARVSEWMTNYNLWWTELIDQAEQTRNDRIVEIMKQAEQDGRDRLTELFKQAGQCNF